MARTPHAPIASEALATVEFPPLGSSKKPGLTRFGGVGRNPRTRAAYSQIQPPSKTRNQSGDLGRGECRRSRFFWEEPASPGGTSKPGKPSYDVCRKTIR